MADRNENLLTIKIGSFLASLVVLAQRGLHAGTLIDLGCADGHFGLQMWDIGLFRGATIVNIDANPLYESSLKRIQAVVGGQYRICAIAEKPGTLDMHMSSTPYWASAAAADDPYWKAINDQRGQKVTVPCRPLDALIDEIAPKPPYFIKLDIQGLEAEALRSGPKTLANTAVVICETALHEFARINGLLEAAGFELFDVTQFHRADDRSLAWFYPVYLNRSYARFRTTKLWADDRNEATVKAQIKRREDILATIDAILARHAGAKTQA